MGTFGDCPVGGRYWLPGAYCILAWPLAGSQPRDPSSLVTCATFVSHLRQHLHMGPLTWEAPSPPRTLHREAAEVSSHIGSMADAGDSFCVPRITCQVGVG